MHEKGEAGKICMKREKHVKYAEKKEEDVKYARKMRNM